MNCYPTSGPCLEEGTQACQRALRWTDWRCRRIRRGFGTDGGITDSGFAKPSSSDTEVDFAPSAPSLEETEEFGRKVTGLSGRAWWQVRKLLAVLTRMRKSLPPSARIEAVRRLGWRLGPGIEACRAIAKGSGPEPTRVPEGGDQIRKFLEEWQQKYKESEDRYRAERDEAFRSDDEAAHAEEQLAAERTAELEKRTKRGGFRPSPRDLAYCGVR